MKTDIEIARETKLNKIEDVAEKLGVPRDEVQNYGRYIAKVPIHLIDKKEMEKHNLILVSAITPNKAGVGKTTVSIGLSLGLNKIGKKAVVALREPSLGPCFGMKGGAAGGGYSQVLPMENINLHFTGDFHAVTSAHNMITALLDNYIYQNRNSCEGLKEVKWKRVLDVNDRSLRNIVSGLGGSANGIPTETGFDITAASEIMAILCLATDIDDLKRRVGNILLGYTYDGKPFTVNDMGIAGAITVLLKDALLPNLVQTTENTPAFIHGGPFANIAHGTSSVIAARTALALADYVVTEAGFGADLGAEKFFDIFARKSGLYPDAVVLVATVRALKMHGGVAKTDLNAENLPALEAGFANLSAHIANLRRFGAEPVVAVNRFVSDTPAELKLVQKLCRAEGVEAVVSEGWGKGGKGCVNLAKSVLNRIELNRNMNSAAAPFSPAIAPASPALSASSAGSPSNSSLPAASGSSFSATSLPATPGSSLRLLYPDALPLTDKIRTVARGIYGAGRVKFTAAARRDLAKFTRWGYGRLPVCIAKTQNSISHDKTLLGAPRGYTFPITEVRLSAGAGFVVALSGEINTMPGLPRHPAAENIDVDENGIISGLF